MFGLVHRPVTVLFDKMKKSFFLLFLIVAAVIQAGFSAEIDSVTPRDLELENSLDMINRIFNQRIQEAIREANAKQSDTDDIEADEFCNVDILYKELRKAIFQSLTASWGLKGYDLDKQLRSLLARQSYSLSLKNSIYRDIDYLEGFSLNFKELSDVVNINGHLIGIDKIGHFFAEGWKYFELTHYDDQGIEQALEWGEEQEKGKYGYTTTGIFSFSDLAANFNGWRFWNKILLKDRDPLKGIVSNYINRPYITCEIQFFTSIRHMKRVKSWKQNARFNFSDYIDGAWDEGNNCNSYKDPVIEEKVSSRIRDINSDFSCPLIAEYCVASKKKYGYYAKYVLHPHCLAVTKE